MQLIQKQYYTPEEYLELEATADYKSEYIDGQIIAMAGLSINHNRISLNLSSGLNFAFKNQNYEVFMGDMRLWIPQKLIYIYPDVIIIADQPEFFNNRTDTITNPQVIMEVLSKSTKSYDKEDKFAAYRTIPTFQEYLLIDQNRIHVEQFSKIGKKRWNFCEYDAEDENISLTTIPFTISWQDIYNKVKFEIAEPETKNNS
ncbi:MAG: Uma2 family endonuclease [Dolichospermum sp.]|jgi:Uma2 family endonuclease|nr:Uma2 family endonuclease [Anabaena sp. 49628_E55]